jgi:hypothetical protein
MLIEGGGVMTRLAGQVQVTQTGSEIKTESAPSD